MDNTCDTGNSGLGAMPSSLKRAVAWGTGHQRLKNAFGIVINRPSMEGRLGEVEPSKRQSRALIWQRCKRKKKRKLVRADIY